MCRCEALIWAPALRPDDSRSWHYLIFSALSGLPRQPGPHDCPCSYAAARRSRYISRLPFQGSVDLDVSPPKNDPIFSTSHAADNKLLSNVARCICWRRGRCLIQHNACRFVWEAEPPGGGSRHRWIDCGELWQAYTWRLQPCTRGNAE